MEPRSTSRYQVIIYIDAPAESAEEGGTTQVDEVIEEIAYRTKTLLGDDPAVQDLLDENNMSLQVALWRTNWL